ncbi:MAG: Gx transporter family protein [Lachnospiraceae bacterium]|nr:Gx transporter family protein [Lachnospiraceae bacterium]
MKKKVAFIGLLIAFGLALSFLESLIPQVIPIPGVKLGLANFAVLMTLYLFGFKEALIMNFARILLASMMFGSAFSFFYALSGALLSILIEVLLIKIDKMSEIGVSVAGGIAHNVGQILLAIIITKTIGVFYYLPFLIVSGILAGIVIGILVKKLRPVLKRIVKD